MPIGKKGVRLTGHLNFEARWAGARRGLVR